MSCCPKESIIPSTVPPIEVFMTPICKRFQEEHSIWPTVSPIRELLIYRSLSSFHPSHPAIPLYKEKELSFLNTYVAEEIWRQYRALVFSEIDKTAKHRTSVRVVRTPNNEWSEISNAFDALAKIQLGY